MTQACGMLELKEQRDAFLTSLCRFTLTDAADSDHSASSRGEAAATTSGERPALLPHTCIPVKDTIGHFRGTQCFGCVMYTKGQHPNDFTSLLGR